MVVYENVEWTFDSLANYQFALLNSGIEVSRLSVDSLILVISLSNLRWLIVTLALDELDNFAIGVENGVCNEIPKDLKLFG